jgi:glycosyltransferase involved in cell wall biosynthesis
MRIAIVHWSRRKVGGAESYLENVVPALIDAGHDVGFWYESDEPRTCAEIALPQQVPVWCAQNLGISQSLKGLREWDPELIYDNSVHNVTLEAELLGIAPAVFYAHAYHGACISGTKSFHLPSTRPCNRKFGWPCLLHYYPRRCGGLDPRTMLRDYRRQSQRLALLRRCQTVVTSSAHMVSEYQRYGLPIQLVQLPVYIPEKTRASAPPATSETHGYHCHQLLYLGRLQADKGGTVLLDAAALAATILPMPLRLIFAGSGPQQHVWESQALRIQKRNARLTVEFVGQVDAAGRDGLLTGTDLLVVPSIWPEPFGLTGLEAGLLGVPAAAFAVGGISDWLEDGINGCLAPGNPPTVGGLADAIVRCLQDTATHSRLRRGAWELARCFSMKKHLNALTNVFENAISSTRR